MLLLGSSQVEACKIEDVAGSVDVVTLWPDQPQNGRETFSLHEASLSSSPWKAKRQPKNPRSERCSTIDPMPNNWRTFAV
jgi:hypothetical protein